MEFAPENEIMNRLIPTMHQWDGVIRRACNKTQVTDVHDESDCNVPTVVAMVEPFLQFQWKNPFLGQFMM